MASPMLAMRDDDDVISCAGNSLPHKDRLLVFTKLDNKLVIVKETQKREVLTSSVKVSELFCSWSLYTPTNPSDPLKSRQ